MRWAENADGAGKGGSAVGLEKGRAPPLKASAAAPIPIPANVIRCAGDQHRQCGKTMSAGSLQHIVQRNHICGTSGERLAHAVLHADADAVWKMAIGQPRRANASSQRRGLCCWYPTDAGFSHSMSLFTSDPTPKRASLVRSVEKSHAHVRARTHAGRQTRARKCTRARRGALTHTDAPRVAVTAVGASCPAVGSGQRIGGLRSGRPQRHAGGGLYPTGCPADTTPGRCRCNMADMAALPRNGLKRGGAVHMHRASEQVLAQPLHGVDRLGEIACQQRLVQYWTDMRCQIFPKLTLV